MDGVYDDVWGCYLIFCLWVFVCLCSEVVNSCELYFFGEFEYCGYVSFKFFKYLFIV